MSSPDRTDGAVRSEGGSLLEPLVRRFLARIDVGSLTVELPSGTRLAHKGAQAGSAGLPHHSSLASDLAADPARRCRFRRELHHGRLVEPRSARFHRARGEEYRAAGSEDRWEFRYASDWPPAPSRARQYANRQPQEHRISLRSRQRLLPMLARREHDLFVRPLCGNFRHARRCASQENRSHRRTSGRWS